MRPLRLALLAKVCRFYRSVRYRALGLRCLETDSKLVEPFLRRRRGCPCEGIRPAGGLREGNDLANVGFTGEERNEALDAQGEPAVWRGTHAKGVEEPAELRPCLLVGHPHRAEDALLDLLAVDPDRARAELPPVPDQVVVLAECGTGIGVDQILVALDGAREGVMHERPPARVLVLEEQREVEDPQNLVARLVDELELVAEVEPERSEHTLDHRRAVRDEESCRPGRALKPLEFALRQELGDRRADRARFVEDEIRETLSA